jgi:hypothetical protein
LIDTPMSSDSVEYLYARQGPVKRSDPKVPWKPLMIKAEREKAKSVDKSASILSKFKQKKTSKTISVVLI